MRTFPIHARFNEMSITQLRTRRDTIAKRADWLDAVIQKHIADWEADPDFTYGAKFQAFKIRLDSILGRRDLLEERRAQLTDIIVRKGKKS